MAQRGKTAGEIRFLRQNAFGKFCKSAKTKSKDRPNCANPGFMRILRLDTLIYIMNTEERNG